MAANPLGARQAGSSFRQPNGRLPAIERGGRIRWGGTNAPAALEVRLEVDPRTVVGDGGGRGAGVQEQPRRQELRRGGQVGGDFLFEDRAGDLVYDSGPL
jgi:hypothetical protein